MLHTLNGNERLQLMRFICSFAWADLRIEPREREFVFKMIKKLHLAPEERSQVLAWLARPPQPEEIDPAEVPLEHRKIFLDAVEQVAGADHDLAVEERESLSLFRQLLH
ncbi:MAG: TerB family tellurite resistance protein [Planctomycetes bacterium]|nr:TerB family tellurite resistance protein [Planctomycetota bacterium]